MKTVLLVNGSPHANGHTRAALDITEQVFLERNICVDHFELGPKPVRGCLGCCKCKDTHRCVFNDDSCNELIAKLEAKSE